MRKFNFIASFFGLFLSSCNPANPKKPEGLPLEDFLRESVSLNGGNLNIMEIEYAVVMLASEDCPPCGPYKEGFVSMYEKGEFKSNNRVFFGVSTNDEFRRSNLGNRGVPSYFISKRIGKKDNWRLLKIPGAYNSIRGLEADVNKYILGKSEDPYVEDGRLVVFYPDSTISNLGNSGILIRGNEIHWNLNDCSQIILAKRLEGEARGVEFFRKTLVEAIHECGSKGDSCKDPIENIYPVELQAVFRNCFSN